MASVSPLPRRRWRLLRTLQRWVDTGEAADVGAEQSGRIDWLRAVPFALMHVACIAVIWVGVSWTAVIVAAALYAVRMFAITAFYHRDRKSTRLNSSHSQISYAVFCLKK